MADREMYAVRVYTTDEGDICIAQDEATQDPSIVLLHPDQISTLIEWLKEAVEETRQTDEEGLPPRTKTPQ